MIIDMFSFLHKETWPSFIIPCIVGVALQALLVFILYVRCTAINPADPGIMSKFDGKGTEKTKRNPRLPSVDMDRAFNEFGNVPHSSPSSVSRSSLAAANSSKKGSVGDMGDADIPGKPATRKSCNINGRIFCALFVREDCRKEEAAAEQQGNGDDALFCTLCNAEV